MSCGAGEFEGSDGHGDVCTKFNINLTTVCDVDSSEGFAAIEGVLVYIFQRGGEGELADMARKWAGTNVFKSLV